MKRRIQKNTLGALVTLLAMSLMSNIWYMENTRVLKEQTNEALLKADSTLSAKLVIEKELDRVKAQLNTFKTR